MSKFEGLRFAVAGVGVSGLGACKAILRHGGTVVAFDEKPADSMQMIRAVDELQAVGVNVVSSWNGRLDPADFDILVVSPGLPRSHPSMRDMASRRIWGEVELAYQISQAPIAAITGTNGKSTTTVLAYILLNAAQRQSRLCGNIAGSGWPEMPLTLAALDAGPDEVLAAEISSFQLETIHEFRPKVAAITNITPDHLDRHPDFADYEAAKLRIFENMGKGDVIVWNAAEESTTFAIPMETEAAVVAFDPTGRSDGRRTARNGDILYLSGQELDRRELSIFGEHSVANIFCAWEMACVFGDPGEAGIEALKNFKGLSNRMEIVGERADIVLINNSMCTNPAAVIASSRALHRPQHLLIGGNTKGLDFAPLAKYLKDSGHKAYIFGPNPDTMNERLGGGFPIFSEMPEALVEAADAAKPGDAVMLAPGCASAAPYASFRERGDAFKKAAKEWLER